MIQPRELVHRSTITAIGIWIDPALIGEPAARRRVISGWSAGTTVSRAAGGYLLRWPSPRVCRTEELLGVALTEREDVLLAAPLNNAEWTAAQASAGDLLLVRSGVLHRIPAADISPVDPAQWLALEDYALATVRSLGKPPAPPQAVAQPVQFDVRTRLTGSAAAPEAVQFQEWLKDADQQTAVAPSWLKQLWERLSSRLRSDTSASAASSAPIPRWQTWLNRLLQDSSLSQIGRDRYARHLMKVMDLFDQGDLDQALRNAIPLSDVTKANQVRVPPPLLPTFGARSTLNINPRQAAASSGFSLEDSLFDALRRMYREAFTRLEAQGRHEEAAFVLAELLQANEEAIAFLERQGKFHLAAELAESRGLSPGIIVRQWFLAGDIPRALAIARRTDCFSVAASALERTRSPHADKFRVLWAKSLAAAGQYGAAVHVVWSVASSRRLVQDWIDQAIVAGGTNAARMLVRRAANFPAAYPETRDRILNLLADESPELASMRKALMEELGQESALPRLRGLARACIRAACRDASRHLPTVAFPELRKLAHLSGDKALWTDLPQFPTVETTGFADRKQPLVLTIDPNDVGATPVYDAVLLPSGRCLVALGEAGVQLLSRDGLVVAHFPQPADRLVLSDTGSRAIAIISRGEVRRLARIDLVAMTSEHWCEAAIDHYAATYDGSIWFVAAGKHLYGIDAVAKRFDALWQVSEIGTSTAIHRTEGELQLLTSDAGTITWWRYQLPVLILRGRSEVVTAEQLQQRLSYSRVLLLRNGPVLAQVWPRESIPGGEVVTIHEYRHEGWRQIFSRPASLSTPPPVAHDQWVAISGGVSDPGFELRYFDLARNCLSVTLAGAQRVMVHFHDELLTACDDRGRILAWNCRDGRQLRDLRI